MVLLEHYSRALGCDDVALHRLGDDKKGLQPRGCA
jgi:hypothetical protein